MAPKSSGGHHFGSRIVFDRAGLTHVTWASAGAQRLDDHGEDPCSPTFGQASGQSVGMIPPGAPGHRNVQGVRDGQRRAVGGAERR